MSRFLFVGKTDIGLHRKKNEDTIHMDQAKRFCLVADGIGGTAVGDVASQMFAQTARDMFSSVSDTEAEKYQLVQHTFLTANDEILNYARQNPECEGMGCTAELLALTSDKFILGHIGDSRTYRLRNNELKQLTTDHTLVQEQLDQKLITQEEANHHSLKNVILRAVGIKKNPSLDVLRGRILPGDRFLMCSDGLTDMVDDTTIKYILSSDSDIEDVSEQLVQKANANGGKDNISVVLIEII